MSRRNIAALVVVPVVLLVSLVTIGVANARSGHQSHLVPTVSSSRLAEPNAKTITISGFAYTVPAGVARGALVNVVNKDGVKHTVTSNTAGKFNVTVPAHSTRSFHAPQVKGSYKFHCAIHPAMTGTLHVGL
jgi:plastocyanin